MMAKNVLTENFSEPLNGATTARVDVQAGDGNLTIDGLTGGEQALASGALQYFEKQGLPSRALDSRDGLASLTLRGSGSGQPWFRLPWADCNGATEWLIHLNPTVSSNITAYSGGGNIRLNLADMAITHVAADTGGGNIDVVLPDKAANLNMTARTGAGNVVVHIPSGVAARIQATTGLGKAIVDPRFSKIDKDVYQSSDFDSADNKVEIAAKSGAGNVVVNSE
jgi:hypothetical protein